MKNTNYDILTVNEDALSIEVIAGKINSYRNKNITKKGLRLFENNKIYSTSFVGEIENQKLIEEAMTVKGNGGVGLPYDYELPKAATLETIDDEGLKKPLTSIQEAIEISQELLAPLSSEYIFTGKFNRSIIERTHISSDGLSLKRKFARNDWHYLYKRVGSPQLFDGYFEDSGSVDDVRDVLKKNLPYLQAYKNEISFKAGKYPVYFMDGGTLLHKLSESFIADKYCLGSALFSGKLNSKIMSSNFSLYDVNFAPEFGLFNKFDGEGTIRAISHLPLIENGVMKNIIADRRSAKKYGLELTGNGQRSPESGVTTAFNSLVIGKGTRSTQEILNSLETCVVVIMASGGDFTDKGDFSTPLQLSFLVKNGEIVGRLPQLTVKTSTQDMFGSRLMEIASDGFQKSFMNPSFFSEMDVYVN